MSDPFSIVSPKLPRAARVAAFHVHEALSRTYEVEVFIVAPTDELEPDGVIGHDGALLVLPEGGGEPMRFAGKIAAFDLLHDDAEGRALARVVIVPALWFLRFSRRSRVFTQSSVVDVITSILGEHGITRVEKRLGSYPVEEHVCQYRESDLDFISRWMEREGIFYTFVHGEAGETLVLSDSASYADDPLGGAVAFLPRLPGRSRRDAAPPSLSTFKRRHVALPSSVSVRDYDYAKPDLAVAGWAQVSATGQGTVSLHGERVFSPDSSARLATLRAEELLAREVIFQAEGHRLHLRPGAKFQLESHPRAAFNAEYLTVEARHVGRLSELHALVEHYGDFPADDTYRVELEAIPAERTYRPAARTVWPRIDGFEHGIVDGPAESDYAQLDDQGRYAVKLAFDESELKDGNATTWLRMMQPHGGGNEGFHFPLRKGTEVLVSFLAGDPDRPVVAGVAPNTRTPSPVTSANHTLNVIQTGALNRFELDDEAGKERIALSTPHANTFLRMGSPLAEDEVELHTAKNGFFSMGESLAVDVGIEAGKGDLVFAVCDSWTSTVEKGDFALSVDAGAFSTTVAGDSTQTIVGGNTKIETRAGTTDISSQQTISLKSILGDLNIEAINSKTNYTGNCDWLVVGNKLDTTMGGLEGIVLGNKLDVVGLACESFVMGNKLDATVGVSESLFIGGSLEVSVAEKVEIDVGFSQTMTIAGQLGLHLGGKSETFVGASGALAVAGNIDMFLGLRLELEMALAYKACASIGLEMNALKVEDELATLKSVGVDLTFGGLFSIA